MLASRAVAKGKVARIALRVNPDVFAETHPYISTGLREHKFGIAIDKARAVYRRAMTLDGVEPARVSVHIGSQIRSVEPFAGGVKRVESWWRSCARMGWIFGLSMPGVGWGSR